MTVHRVRLWHSVAGADSFHNWLSQWLTNMEPWAADEVTNEVPQLRETIDGSDEYYQTDLAFEWTEDKAIIMDNLHIYMRDYCDWHQLAYHICTNDEDDPSPCSWDDVTSSGTPPDYVPTIVVGQ